MKSKVVSSHSGTIPKATNCLGKATTSLFGKSGASLKEQSNALPKKAIK